MPDRLPVILTAADINALLLTARLAADNARTPTKRLAAWRDFVMVETSLLSGPRVSELCDLQVTDIDLARAMLAIQLGKGSKDRNIPVGARLLIVLREWIGDRTAGWLFPGPKGRRLNPRTFQRRLDRLATVAGIAKDIHPHLLRHSFACSLLRSGADIREVQEALGHANLATTQVYLHVDQARLRAAMDRL
jgi:site-specific recombinase XerD